MSGDLIARCRETLAASDGLAKAAAAGTAESMWVAYLGGVNAVMADAERFVAENSPSTRMALNRALTVVLDGTAATLARLPEFDEDAPAGCLCPRCSTRRNALTTLAAIAEALEVQEEGL